MTVSFLCFFFVVVWGGVLPFQCLAPVAAEKRTDTLSDPLCIYFIKRSNYKISQKRWFKRSFYFYFEKSYKYSIFTSQNIS